LTADELRRALDFLRLADRVGRVEQETRFGPLVLTPERPLRWDSNYLLVERPGTTDELVAEAERAFAAAGIGHRKLSVPDETTGGRLWEELPAEWVRQRLLVMALRRPPEREASSSAVEEVDEARLRPLRAQEMARQPWGQDPEVVRQLLDAKRATACAVETRFFAVVVDGEPVSCADLYLAGGVAQVEDVLTTPDHRNRGFASAVVLTAVCAADEAGADFVFLVADEDDWPEQLYRRLGFDPIGRVHEFILTGQG
jgi:GNAT superfamily N-acetyltransferase